MQPANACTVCIIESNPLAAEYLAGILGQDAVIDVRLFDQFVSSGSQTSPLIFCMDLSLFPNDPRLKVEVASFLFFLYKAKRLLL